MKHIKNVESFAFENQYGWMNSMKGERWTTLVKTYRAEVAKEVATLQPLVKTLETELQGQPSYTHGRTLSSYSYEMQGHQSIRWSYKTITKGASDIDIEGDYLWSVDDRSKGKEQYTLALFEKGVQQWIYTRALGPFVATQGDRCFAVEVENYLWMCRVISVDAKTGSHRRVELELKDPRWNFQLIKGTHSCLFIIANNAGVQRCWVWKESAFVEEKGYTSFVPIGYLTANEKTPCFFGKKVGANHFTAVHFNERLPHLHNLDTPEWYDPFTKLLVTKRFGVRTLWKNGSRLETVLGMLDIDTLPSWRGKVPDITVVKPGAYRQTFGEEPLCPYARSSLSFTKSLDGTSIPYITVSNCKPRKLLCIVYGAYGLPTRVGTDRWKPLLDRGWGLCLALVRGSGDHTDAWAEAGRRENKVKSVEDFEACVVAAQRQFRLSSKDTFLYGRSAGGYTVGAALSRNANGTLFQGVYTEVPYVDVLATTSNPDLPLTKLEYDEFGDPRRLQNAKALVSLSPIHSLPETGAPGIYVLSRTALNDKQVYAYETVKWITKLKELDTNHSTSKPKLCAIEGNEGHFSSFSSVTKERAQDLAIVLSWASNKKSHLEIYQMVPSRRNRRNNVTARKNNVTARKNNIAMRKRRNNVTMGGKRRRNNATARKSRRSNRK